MRIHRRSVLVAGIMLALFAAPLAAQYDPIFDFIPRSLKDFARAAIVSRHSVSV